MSDIDRYTVDVSRVLESRRATERAVAAARMALAVLEGPSPTVDGDSPAMVARSLLRAAFVDHDAIIDAVRP